jgi:hypothetical protein
LRKYWSAVIDLQPSWYLAETLFYAVHSQCGKNSTMLLRSTILLWEIHSAFGSPRDSARGKPARCLRLSRQCLRVSFVSCPPTDEIAALASTFGVHENTVYNWEDPVDHVIPYHQLLNYQKCFNLTPGCAYLVAEMAEYARNGDSRKLECLATMVIALANRVLKHPGEPPLVSYKEDWEGESLSDQIITDLFATINKSAPSDEINILGDEKVKGKHRKNQIALERSRASRRNRNRPRSASGG